MEPTRALAWAHTAKSRGDRCQLCPDSSFCGSKCSGLWGFFTYRETNAVPEIYNGPVWTNNHQLTRICSKLGSYNQTAHVPRCPCEHTRINIVVITRTKNNDIMLLGITSLVYMLDVCFTRHTEVYIMFTHFPVLSHGHTEAQT